MMRKSHSYIGWIIVAIGAPFGVSIGACTSSHTTQPTADTETACPPAGGYTTVGDAGTCEPRQLTCDGGAEYGVHCTGGVMPAGRHCYSPLLPGESVYCCQCF